MYFQENQLTHKCNRPNILIKYLIKLYRRDKKLCERSPQRVYYVFVSVNIKYIKGCSIHCNNIRIFLLQKTKVLKT